jgi:non-homologous end joining protein Ku
MPARPTWKGYLKISLVNIPIKVFPATDAGATLSFNQLHAECQTRIQQKRWCPHCQREVANTDIVKGFEFEKGQYVVVDEEDEDFLLSSRVMNEMTPNTFAGANPGEASWFYIFGFRSCHVIGETWRAWLRGRLTPPR